MRTELPCNFLLQYRLICNSSSRIYIMIKKYRIRSALFLS
uniref:Uncharacterized protein n=1 Tax=Arundo donax TaxID=35708 RepID=A0A0A8Y893_ARUDO